jgi:hypothetical protein
MSDALTMAGYINQSGYLSVIADGSKQTYRVPIVIVDAKRAYGRLRFCVRVSQKVYGNPTEREWVNAERVTLKTAKE